MPFFVGKEPRAMLPLEYHRRTKDIKQKELAKKAGFAPCYISAVERRILRPSENFKTKIAEALGMPKEILFPRGEQGIFSA